MSRNVIFAIVGVMIGLVLAALYYLSRPYTFRGSLIVPPVPAANFTLTDGGGKPFSLNEERGKVVLMFFGYTTCPDVCPATLSEMKQVFKSLGSQAGSVRFIFITVDPQRDTPEKIGKYVASFDPSFIGLTGSEADLTPVWKDYGVYRAIEQDSSSAAGYQVSHSSQIYLIDQSGNLYLTYAFGTPVDDIVQDLRYMLKHKDG